ncbi:MAG TPA: hypothetical protein VNN72_02515, partial [Polyangiaceae bacterium]|nr:hypothetical protein [Polyangiaceae bacterium]
MIRSSIGRSFVVSTVVTMGAITACTSDDDTMAPPDSGGTGMMAQGGTVPDNGGTGGSTGGTGGTGGSGGSTGGTGGSTGGSGGSTGGTGGSGGTGGGSGT